jgi:hypothetical protein
MLASVKLGADFSAGCALSFIACRFLATHPHHPVLREVTLGDTPWLPHRSAPCRIVDRQFREVTFQALG